MNAVGSNPGTEIWKLLANWAGALKSKKTDEPLVKESVAVALVVDPVKSETTTL